MQTALAQGGGTLPSLSSNGTVSLILHQVNADGGGPFTAMVNADATGATWVPATVLVQAPGSNGILQCVSSLLRTPSSKGFTQRRTR
jgi:hypothetical protein